MLNPTELNPIDFGAVYDASFSSGTDSTQAVRDCFAYAAQFEQKPKIVISGNLLTGDIPEILQHQSYVIEIQKSWFLTETLHIERSVLLGNRWSLTAGFSREGTAELAAHNSMPEGTTTLHIQGHNTAEIKNINIRARAGIGIESYGVRKTFEGVVIGVGRNSNQYEYPALRLCNTYWTIIDKCTFGVRAPADKESSPDYPEAQNTAVWIGTDATQPNADHTAFIDIRNTTLSGGSITLDPKDETVASISIQDCLTEFPFTEGTDFLIINEGERVLNIRLRNCDLADNNQTGHLINNKNRSAESIQIDCPSSFTSTVTGYPINGLFFNKLSGGIAAGDILQASTTHDKIGFLGNTLIGKVEAHWWNFGLAQPGPWLLKTNQQPTGIGIINNALSPNGTHTAFTLESTEDPNPFIYSSNVNSQIIQTPVSVGDIFVATAWVKRPTGKTKFDILRISSDATLFTNFNVPENEKSDVTSKSSPMWAGMSLQEDAEYWTVTHAIAIVSSVTTPTDNVKFTLKRNNVGDPSVDVWLPTLDHIPVTDYNHLRDVYKQIDYKLMPCDCSLLANPEIAADIANGAAILRSPTPIIYLGEHIKIDVGTGVIDCKYFA